VARMPSCSWRPKLKQVLYVEARKEFIFSLLTLRIGAVERFASPSSMHAMQWSAYTGASLTWARPTAARAEQVGATSPGVLDLDVCAICCCSGRRTRRPRLRRPCCLFMECDIACM
jgi:hypothetical protein